jgi:hypothetical protein
VACVKVAANRYWVIRARTGWYGLSGWIQRKNMLIAFAAFDRYGAKILKAKVVANQNGRLGTDNYFVR